MGVGQPDGNCEDTEMRGAEVVGNLRKCEPGEPPGVLAQQEGWIRGQETAAWPWLGRGHTQVKTIEGFQGELLLTEARMGKLEPCCRWMAVWAVRWREDK